MVVRTSRSLVATCACLALLGASACSDVRHVVGKADLSASGGASSIAGSSARPSGGQGGSSGGAPLAGGGGVATFDASLPDPVPACAQGAVVAQRRQLDLYLVLDTNITTAFERAWQTVTDGIRIYSRMPAAEGTGLGYDVVGAQLLYPTTTCDADDYEMPYVGIGQEPLPANADAIDEGLDEVDQALSIPLAHVLEGALRYTSSIRNSYGTKPVVVLITDGFPDFACGASIDRIAEVSASGLSRGLITYVIELPQFREIPIIGEIIELAFPLNLAPIAQASRTELRTLTQLDDADHMANLLLGIQQEAVPCDYALPEGLTWQDVQLAVDEGGPRPLPRLTDSSECGGASGVFLDPATGFASACTQTCQLIKRTARPALWVRDCTP